MNLACLDKHLFLNSLFQFQFIINFNNITFVINYPRLLIYIIYNFVCVKNIFLKINLNNFLIN